MANKPNLGFLAEVPAYTAFNIPKGYLADEPACHALFHYALMIVRQENEKKFGQVYEGELWPESRVHNAHELFKSVALLYGVAPERMLHFWVNVDMQFNAMGSKLRVPEKLRFNKSAELKTQ